MTLAPAMNITTPIEITTTIFCCLSRMKKTGINFPTHIWIFPLISYNISYPNESKSALYILLTRSMVLRFL